MKWIVGSTTKAAKQAESLPEDAYLSLQVLFENLQVKGPNPGHHWPHYSKEQVRINSYNWRFILARD